ncbi:hypothetical protein LX36DRAFT_195762 [Colletotrichum falcatum]|nr:hypothetical protein LX36DRAFT_195762 [Colletotrichum falcatum]
MSHTLEPHRGPRRGALYTLSGTNTSYGMIGTFCCRCGSRVFHLRSNLSRSLGHERRPGNVYYTPIGATAALSHMLPPLLHFLALLNLTFELQRYWLAALAKMMLESIQMGPVAPGPDAHPTPSYQVWPFLGGDRTTLARHSHASSCRLAHFISSRNHFPFLGRRIPTWPSIGKHFNRYAGRIKPI